MSPRGNSTVTPQPSTPSNQATPTPAASLRGSKAQRIQPRRGVRGRRRGTTNANTRSNLATSHRRSGGENSVDQWSIHRSRIQTADAERRAELRRKLLSSMQDLRNSISDPTTLMQSYPAPEPWISRVEWGESLAFDHLGHAGLEDRMRAMCVEPSDQQRLAPYNPFPPCLWTLPSLDRMGLVPPRGQMNGFDGNRLATGAQEAGQRFVHLGMRSKRQKTYNSGDSLVVTDPTTDPPLTGLTMGERTGSRIFQWVWSVMGTDSAV
ncbi:hypothetical protein F53441_5390 [Fusarium austroafricanum]|uniref:Uncharacterized protein n=1 Tax=Fusarium austroafricanum TaxID=2364996 RepID=A0A8H4P0R3_9HYPO|nr:hypothetical protein F53441_5390 [Fusarium austroafricanum]